MARIGKYEVTGPLGRGGSGSVFRAYDPVLDRLVAIKLLTNPLESSSIDPKELARLRSEGRAAARLNHENIVSVFGLEEDKEGHPFLVMQLLEGADLSDSFSPGAKVPIRQAVEIMHQVAQGLQHSHSKGVVHRDVSPRNIRVLPDGSVKMIDFGIAGGFQGGRTMTDVDRQLGTVLFFSPEHLADSTVELDPRSDIFSYGSVFYVLLAGSHPFAGEDDQETVCNILLHEPEPLINLRPDCPPMLAKIIHRALLKDLDLRYPNFRSVLRDLDPVLMELRQPEADEHFAIAQKAVAEGRVEDARAALSQSLDLVREHAEARTLLDDLNKQHHESKVREKVRSLLNEAEQRSQERRFREAVSLLEKAHGTDPESSEATQKLDAARSALERHEECARLVKKAEDHRRRGELDAALAAATEAEEIDPADAGAARTAGQLRSEVEADCRKRVSEGLSQARQLLAEEQFVAAEALLISLTGRFPDVPAFQALLAYARSELSARKRRQVVEYARSETIRRAAFGQHALALEAIDQALEQYPDDRDLIRLRAAIQSSIEELEKKAAPTKVSGDGDSGRRICACGTVLKAGTKFCDHCGVQVNR